MHPDTAACRNQLAVAYRLAGRTAEASRLFDRNPNSPAHASALAAPRIDAAYPEQARRGRADLRECLTIRQKIQPDDWTTFDTKSFLGEALLDQKQFAEAEPLLLLGLRGHETTSGHDPAQEQAPPHQALERSVKLYEAWGKEDKAMRWRKELETAKSQTSRSDRDDGGTDQLTLVEHPSAASIDCHRAPRLQPLQLLQPAKIV